MAGTNNNILNNIENIKENIYINIYKLEKLLKLFDYVASDDKNERRLVRIELMLTMFDFYDSIGDIEIDWYNLMKELED